MSFHQFNVSLYSYSSSFFRFCCCCCFAFCLFPFHNSIEWFNCFHSVLFILQLSHEYLNAALTERRGNNVKEKNNNNNNSNKQHLKLNFKQWSHFCHQIHIIFSWCCCCYLFAKYGWQKQKWERDEERKRKIQRKIED